MRTRLVFALIIVTSIVNTTLASAQPQSGYAPITLQGDSRGCLTRAAIEARIKHYRSDKANAAALHVHVRAPDSGTTEFVIAYAGNTAAVRRFQALPQACADRLDAIALAIALAIEQAVPSHPAVPDQPAGSDGSHATTGVDMVAAAPDNQPNQSLPPTTGSSTTSRSVVDAELARSPHEAARGMDTRKTDAALAASRETRPRADPPVRPQPRAAPPVERVVVSLPNTTHTPLAEQRDSSDDDERDFRHSRPSAWRLGLHAGGNVIFEVLPAPVIAGALGLELSIDDHLSIRASGLLSTQSRREFGDGTAVVQLVGGRASMCWATRFDWFPLNTCLGAIAGRVKAEGRGYYDDETVKFPWLAMLLRVGTRVLEHGPVALELAVEGYTNLLRPSLGIDRSTAEPLTTPVLAVSGGLDLICYL